MKLESTIEELKKLQYRIGLVIELLEKLGKFESLIDGSFLLDSMEDTKSTKLHWTQRPGAKAKMAKAAKKRARTKKNA